MSIKQTKIWKFFSSVKLAIWLLAIIASLSLVGTLIPQNEEAGGLRNVYGSWWFIFFLIMLSLNLTVCLLNRFSLKIRSLGSTVSHLSILVILFGALIGMFLGQKGFIQLSNGEEANSFLNRNGKPITLDFSIRLNQFIYNEDINPQEKLLICSPAAGNVCELEGHSGAASGIDKSKGVIAQIPTETGIEHNIADTGYKVKVLRYIPDFVIDTSTKVAVSRSAQPNNPAIEVELKDKDGNTKTFWIFVRFPDMHQEASADFKFLYRWMGRTPKDFISKVTILRDNKEITSKDIRVNDPLRFGGYTFFQSSYDSERLNWSGLQVVKDPGVPIVYLGFTLLILGLMAIFYVNPLLKKG